MFISGLLNAASFSELTEYVLSVGLEHTCQRRTGLTRNNAVTHQEKLIVFILVTVIVSHARLNLLAQRD